MYQESMIAEVAIMVGLWSVNAVQILIKFVLTLCINITVKKHFINYIYTLISAVYMCKYCDEKQFPVVTSVHHYLQNMKLIHKCHTYAWNLLHTKYFVLDEFWNSYFKINSVVRLFLEMPCLFVHIYHYTLSTPQPNCYAMWYLLQCDCLSWWL